MAKLKTNTSFSDVMRNKSKLIKKLTSTSKPNEYLLSFGYYMTTQSDHLYNLSYYIDQIQNYESDIAVFKNKRKLYSRVFNIFTSNAQCSLWSNINVSVYIDSLYILTNKELEYETKEYIKKTQEYKFAIDRYLANKFDLKNNNIKKNIFLRVLCEDNYATAEDTINIPLTDFEFKNLNTIGLCKKISDIIVKTVTKIHAQIKQNDEKK